MDWAEDHPIAAADEGAPPGFLSRVSALNFRLCLAAAVFLLAILLPSTSFRAPRHRPITVSGVMKLDPDLSVSTVSSRPRDASPTGRVLILPGLAAGAFSFRDVYRSLASRGLLAVAIDLPGQGLSPKPTASFFRVLVRLLRTGGDSRAPPSPYAPAQAAAAVARAVDALGVAPVHLVLHDSALAAGAAFASANPWAVRSVTLLDAAATPQPAFPAAVFGVPVAGRLVLWAPPLFRLLLRLCCVRGTGLSMAAHEHRALMMWKQTEWVVEAWKAMNRSFELGEWRRSSEEVRELPMMVLWSGTWSDWWIKEGHKVAAALPDAKFLYHSGSRWPQVDAAVEISELITEFVTSFEEATGDYIQQPVTSKKHYSQLETNTRSVSINPGEIFYGTLK
ncbi:hypothetical protein EJB05_27151, partial [Eragrostis curvula]